MKLPKTTEEQILNLLAKGANRNWVERVAYESGIDFDHIRQIDEDFCDKFSNKEQNNEI